MISKASKLDSQKIAFYLPSLRGGGAERIMVTLANAFAEQGLSVDMVLAKATGQYLSQVAPAVRVVDLGASRVITSLPGLVSYLRHERPQAMLSALNHANVVAVWARQIARVSLTLVVAEHNNLSSTLARGRLDRTGWMPRFMRIAYPKAEAVVAVSKGVADDLARTIGFPRGRIDVVLNPIDARLIQRRSLEPVEHQWFRPGEPPVILGAGRLTMQKGFPTLIRAFAKLREKREARLVILGEGELQGTLQGLIADLGMSECIALPGFIENPFAWMRAADLFVLSSVWEGLPTVLIEAMACGSRVVSTDCPSGPSEILENGQWGRLVPTGNVDALSCAMCAALDDAEPPDVARRAADFSIESAVAGYLKALQVKLPNELGTGQ